MCVFDAIDSDAEPTAAAARAIMRWQISFG
jgi:hypothetical protein